MRNNRYLEPVAKTEESVRIINGTYRSNKRFVVASAKLSRFCLDPNGKHSKEFFDVGYTVDDSDLLFQHIEEGFDMNKKIGERMSQRGEHQFSIPIKLGVTTKQIFNTAWQIDDSSIEPRLITIYLDRRLKEDA